MVIVISPGSSAHVPGPVTGTCPLFPRVLFPKLVFNTVTIHINHRPANLLRSFGGGGYDPHRPALRQKPQFFSYIPIDSEFNARVPLHCCFERHKYPLNFVTVINAPTIYTQNYTL